MSPVTPHASGTGPVTVHLRRWWPDALLGGSVFVFGLLTVTPWDSDVSRLEWLLLVVVALGMGTATGLFRVAPGLALGLVWAISMFQVATGLDVTAVQLAVVVVAYGAARHGSVVTLWASGLSIPLGAVAALGYLGLVASDGFASPLVRVLPMGGSHHLIKVLIGSAIGFVFLVALLAMPWTLGLALRLRRRADRSAQQRLVAEADRARALEIAQLREDQTRLARDVHDVVGHSLAVILAQAESAQFRPESDTAAVRGTLENIAVSARQSLRDVRQVLSSTSDTTSATSVTSGSLDALIDGVRDAGHQVHSVVVGTERSLPSELDVVAFRVLQEMLTNALKHGRRGGPVRVERQWNGELRLKVSNAVAEPAGADAAPTPTEHTVPFRAGVPGRGLEGMRRRLESVGGRLDSGQRESPAGGATFTATAWVPLQTGPG